MSKTRIIRTEAGEDPVEYSANVLSLANRATNEAIAGAESHPFVSLPDAESSLRKEFETLSERIYRDGRDSTFDTGLVGVTALRVAAGALRIAALAGAGR